MIIGVRIYHNNQMIYPLQYLVKQNVLNSDVRIKTIDSNPANEIETTDFMLFTGRFADNGCIYAKDILKITLINRDIKGLVLYDVIKMMFTVETEIGTIQLPDSSMIEIIGNEYQNKELYLEVKELIKKSAYKGINNVIEFMPLAIEKCTAEKNHFNQTDSQLERDTNVVYKLYTDGSCLKNPGGAGGWAYQIVVDDNVIEENSGGSCSTTNQRMELEAAIQGLRALGNSPVIAIVTSDSQYLVNGFLKGWVEKWKRDNWYNSKGEVVANIELWKELDRLNSYHSLKWGWEKGHSTNKNINRCDELAGIAALKQQNINKISS